MQPRQLRAFGTGAKTLSILSRNVYGWFSRVNRGLYAVTPKGREALAKYPELVRHYRSLPTGQVTKLMLRSAPVTRFDSPLHYLQSSIR
jgi:hypothetical protein